MNSIKAFLITTRGPAGPPGVLGNYVLGEAPAGAIDGVNTTFTAAADFDKLWVWWNGLRMKEGTDYTITDTDEFEFATAPLVGDTILIDYVEAS